MKRLHIHLTVKQLETSIQFYSTLFGQQPSLIQSDYAKWDLVEPAVNFAISNRQQSSGVNHLGIQTDKDEDLHDLAERLQQADIATAVQSDANCCYARSNKHWTVDPDGMAWEAFHTLEQVPMYGKDTQTTDKGVCCLPAAT